MKISIVVYSKSGRTREAARWIGQGIEEVEGCEYQIMSVEDIDKEYLEESDAVIFGTPTYYANMCWQMKKWIDEGCSGVNLAGKLGAVFATANVVGGGSETAMLTLINHILVKGMLVYSAGSSCGQPFTHIGVTSIKEISADLQKDKITVFGTRIAEKTKELFSR